MHLVVYDTNMKKGAKLKYLIGIDEVGRGPLAGPVAVGAVCIRAQYARKVKKLFPIIKDSKKLTPKKREEWRERIRDAEKMGYLSCAVSYVAPAVIDKKGLTIAVQTAIDRSLSEIEHDAKETSVILDGGLHAPKQYLIQKTIIKGDEKELAIALASIVAKVARDARMVRLSKKFPEYGFEKHKGYGTRAHYAALKKHGLTPHHRRSFLRKLKP